MGKRDERRYEWKRGVLKGRKGTTEGMTGKYREGMGERVLNQRGVVWEGIKPLRLRR